MRKSFNVGVDRQRTMIRLQGRTLMDVEQPYSRDTFIPATRVGDSRVIEIPVGDLSRELLQF